MRTFLLLVFAVLVAAWPCEAQTSAGAAQGLNPQRERLRRVIAQVPSRSDLAECERIIKEGTPTWKKSEVTEARRKVRRAQREIPRLFKLVKVGTSVFDYPGLLALGPIGSGVSSLDLDSPPSFHYWLLVGGPPLESTDTVAGEFNVGFDAKGIVLYVEDTVCRR